ncbi:hypothetical protein [Pedobacter nutrimenti]|uniref:hypothetical protein n=1 Tax=Pedobacter nutrimenti TaxID=1241337 RepID=UPI002930BC0F|nr:hypothetical protein [Pedobacter nutrimenti]
MKTTSFFFRKKAAGTLLFAVLLVLSINLAFVNKTQPLNGKLKVTVYQNDTPIMELNNIYVFDHFVLEKVTSIFDTVIYNPKKNLKVPAADTTVPIAENFEPVKHSTTEKLTSYLISNLTTGISSKFDLSETNPTLIEKLPLSSKKKEGLQLSDYLNSINLPVERLKYSKDTLLNHKSFKMFVDTTAQPTASGLRTKTICYLDPSISNLSFHISKEFDQRNKGFLSRIDVFYKDVPPISTVCEFQEGLEKEEVAFIQRYISLSEKK